MEPITTGVAGAGAGLSGLIVYFLKRALNRIDKAEAIMYETKNKLALVESDYLNKIENLNEKFDSLNLNIKDLTKELKELNNRLLDN